MLTRRCIHLLLLLFVVTELASPADAFAWGERGHDLVARIAARLVVARSKDRKIAEPFIEREHLLGHLSNVPDIIWRDGDEETVKFNSPTHYVDLEYLAAKVSYDAIPRDVKALEAQMKALCAKATASYICPEDSQGNPTISMVGSNPFRVRQFFDLMAADFGRAKAALDAKNDKEFVAQVNAALLHGGLMAHFVGDLGNPEHGTRDYDGWEKGQGGLHGFFESQVINALPLSLDHDAYVAALTKRPYARVQQILPAAERAQLDQDPLAVAFALALESYARLPELEKLDKQFAVTKPSSREKGMKLKAQRKPAAAVAPKFHALIVERIATAADTLAHLYVLAWTKGGSPDLSTYKSYAYPVSPAFIKPDYL